MENIKKWEYLEKRWSWGNEREETLRNIGLAGWELVSVCQEMDGTAHIKNGTRGVCLLYTFKRPVQE